MFHSWQYQEQQWSEQDWSNLTQRNTYMTHASRQLIKTPFHCRNFRTGQVWPLPWNMVCTPSAGFLGSTPDHCDQNNPTLNDVCNLVTVKICQITFIIENQIHSVDWYIWIEFSNTSCTGFSTAKVWSYHKKYVTTVFRHVCSHFWLLTFGHGKTANYQATPILLHMTTAVTARIGWLADNVNIFTWFNALNSKMMGHIGSIILT
jgi:hypothetical protein